MVVREMVTLTDLGCDPSVLLQEFQERFGFVLSGQSLVVHRDYSPEFIRDVTSYLSARGISTRVRQSIYPQFTPQDFEQAPLLQLIFADLWLDELDFARVCPTCGKKRISIDYSRMVDSVPSDREVLGVNGHFVIVSASALNAIRRDALVGAEFPQFDRQGRYHYLRPTVDLGAPIIRHDEVSGLEGACERCSFPRFSVFFGPLRFPSSHYHGEDFLWTSVFDDLLFSRRAYRLLRSLDRGVEKDRPAYLE